MCLHTKFQGFVAPVVQVCMFGTGCGVPRGQLGCGFQQGIMSFPFTFMILLSAFVIGLFAFMKPIYYRD